MEKTTESIKLINMFLHPVFLVRDGAVAEVNDAAKALQIKVDTKVSALIPQALEDYEAFAGGYLSLTVSIGGVEQLATVMRAEDADVFHLLSSNMSAEFRTMALISRQIKKPLTGILAASDSLRPSVVEDTPETKAQIAQINRNLYQLLRKVSNMSAVERIATHHSSNQQICHITALFDSIMEKATEFVSRSKRTLNFTNLSENIQALGDEELIERAIYNLISNAVKFSPVDSVVFAKLTRSGKRLRFTVENKTEAGCDLTNLHARFMREPGYEDDRHGIGLGIPLVQHIASIHNGSLLMDQPEEGVVRFNLTIPIRQNTENIVRSPIMPFDYLGGHDHALVELSEILSADLYVEYL